MDLASPGCSSNQAPSCVVDQALDHRAHFGGDELVLGLRGELRIGHLHREHAGQPLARVVAGERHLLLLGDAAFVGIVVDHARQRRAETRQMRAAVALRNVVGEAQDILVIAVVPPQGAVDRDAVLLAVDHDRLGQHGHLGAVEIAHEGGDAAFVEAARSPFGSTPRVSASRMRTPELRKASSRRRCSSVAKSNSVLVKVSVEGRNVTSVPRSSRRLADDLQRRHRHRHG